MAASYAGEVNAPRSGRNTEVILSLILDTPAAAAELG